MMTITDTMTGLPIVCDTCRAPATFILSHPIAGRFCDRHSPMSLANMTVAAGASGITGHTICPTCGR